MRRKHLRIFSASTEATERLGRCLARCLREGDILTLDGDLGAGKTRLTQGLARELGIRTEISSPTFTILRDYVSPVGGRKLYHFDVYRLRSAEDFESHGFREYTEGDGISVIEWADVVKDALPDSCVRLRISLCPSELSSAFPSAGAGGTEARVAAEDEFSSEDFSLQEIQTLIEQEARRCFDLDAEEHFVETLCREIRLAAADGLSVAEEDSHAQNSGR